VTPTLPAFLAVAALVALGVLVGVAAGRWWTRRSHAADLAWWDDTYADLADPYDADMEAARQQVADAEAAITELRESIPKVWDAGVAAARQMCAHHHDGDGLEVWELPAEVVERARTNANRRLN
jgi:hypothetical protein